MKYWFEIKPLPIYYLIHYILLTKQMFWPGEQHYSNVSVFNKIAKCYKN